MCAKTSMSAKEDELAELERRFPCLPVIAKHQSLAHMGRLAHMRRAVQASRLFGCGRGTFAEVNALGAWRASEIQRVWNSAPLVHVCQDSHVCQENGVGRAWQSLAELARPSPCLPVSPAHQNLAHMRRMRGPRRLFGRGTESPSPRPGWCLACTRQRMGLEGRAVGPCVPRKRVWQRLADMARRGPCVPTPTCWHT
jgi:hypothetical protein